jgi:hypothetical protein
MAKPGRPERNRAARSFRQLRRFHHAINSDKVFGTHKMAHNISQRNSNRRLNCYLQGCEPRWMLFVIEERSYELSLREWHAISY